MASSKERLRWDGMWAEAMKRMERQRVSITRLVMMNSGAMAALLEIRALDPMDKEGFGKAQGLAQDALDRIEIMAAANPAGTEESVVEAEPN